MTPNNAELLEKLTRAQREDNEVPSSERARQRERAATLVSQALGSDLPAGRLRVSPLGAGWSGDLDVYLDAPVAYERLQALGWVPLKRLSRSDDPYGRWAVTADDKVLAGLDVHVGETRERNEVEAVLARCRRRGRVGVREVLELRVLQRNGFALAGSRPILAAAARAEAALGGTELSQWRQGSAEMPPIELGRSLPARLKSRAGRIARRPMIVAVSGVDGAGKSTLADALASELRATGLEVQRVWARPGMEMRLVKGLAKTLKRLLGMGSGTAVRRIARGEASAAAPSSRRGVIGWAWALLVTLSYVAKVRGAVLRHRGVLVFDRHLLDALVTLDFIYGGVNLRVQRAIIRKLIPKASVTLYLAIGADDAVGRKQSAVFGEFAVRSQLDHYDRLRTGIQGLIELDATKNPDVLAAEAFRTVATGDTEQASTEQES